MEGGSFLAILAPASGGQAPKGCCAQIYAAPVERESFSPRNE